jgi:hypothetical protein
VSGRVDRVRADGVAGTWRLGLTALIAAALLLAAAAPADASREPTGSEARAIKKAFLKKRDVKTKIRRIRVSTVRKRFAAVSYRIRIAELSPARAGATSTFGSGKSYPAPSPVLLKKKAGGKWKTVPKAPKKVRKDLKETPRSDIRISGEVSAHLTRAASCTESSGFYSAGIYHPASDTYLSVQIPSYTGPHRYPALAVHSLAALSVGNGGTVPQWETGQGNDAWSPSGEIWVDPGRWGIIEATMARIPDAGGTYPQSVTVSGIWDCR